MSTAIDSAPKQSEQKLTQQRRLIVNADDFGRSRSINDAVIRAHRDGILTTASLMVNEPGADEAIGLAKENPRLGVGLHLSLLCGRSALAPKNIPGLVDGSQRFTSNPAAAGFNYFFNRSLRSQLEAEIVEQFRRFQKSGLQFDHVNGHLHMHLHPVVFGILMKIAPDFGVRSIRLTRDPFWLNAQISKGFWLYRLTHACIYAILSARARTKLDARGVSYTTRVFGLLQNARVDSDYVMALLPRLPAGDSELYSHPSVDEFKNELDALINPRVLAEIKDLGIELVRYQDL